MNTQTPTRTDAPAAQRELRADLAGLSREAVSLSACDWDLWCEAVHLRLRLLRAQLRSRFGLVEERAAGAKLLREHRALLVRLDALAMEAALHVEPPLWSAALRELLADIALHEERENELLRRVSEQPSSAPD